MGYDGSYGHDYAREQAEGLRAAVPEELIKRPSIPCADYMEELKNRGYVGEAVRTALADLIAQQTIVLVHPGNLLTVTYNQT